MRTRASTIVDVAHAAGVSRQTVSNVLNSPDIVRPETRARVEAAIAELRYRPHASARRLRTQRSSTIGVRVAPVTDGISGAVHDRFLHSLTEQADRKGWRVMLFAAHTVEEELHQYRSLSRGSDVDGFVVSGTAHDDPRLQWLIDHGQPFVAFGRPWGLGGLDDPRCRWVDVDGRRGVHEATQYLLSQGLRRIAFAGWPSPSGTGDERRLGWRSAMREAGAPDADLEVLQVGVREGIAGGIEAVHRLEEAAGAFDGLVCASDSLALGALMASRGRVPLVGFDNTPVASSIGFPSVEQPVDEVAAAVLDMMSSRAGRDVGQDDDAAGDDGPARPPAHRLLAPRLVVRRREEGVWGLGVPH